MAVPTIVNLGHAEGGSGITKPAGGQTGDFYVVVVYTEDGSTFSLSGFTSFGADSFAADTQAGGIVGRVNAFWRAYDGTEAATFSPSGLGSYSHFQSWIVRGARSPIFNAFAYDYTNTMSVAGITAPADDTLLIMPMSRVAGPNNPDQGPGGSPWTGLLDVDNYTSRLWSRQVAAGSTGDITFTFDALNNSPVHVGLIAFAPGLVRVSLTSDAESGDLTTPAFTPPDGSLLVVVATAQDGGNSAFTAASNMGIDDSQNLTWTPFLDVDPPSGEVNYSPHIRCWYTEITTGVSMTVDIMGVSAAINGVVAAVMAWTGYDTADPIGATVTDNNVADDGADSMSLGAAPAASSEVIGALAHGINGFGTITAAHGSTFTELFDLMYIDNVGMSVESRIGSTSTTVDWTDTEVEGNGAYDTIALAFEIKAASAGAGSVDITGTSATVTVTAGSGTIGYLTRTNLTAKQTTTDGATSIQTDAFTPSDNSLLCVMATLQRQGAGSLPVANMAITDSVGLTWTPEVGAVGSLDWGPTTRIWTAPVTTGVSMTVTVSVTGGPVSHSQFIAVVDYVSYDTESSIGATASEPINDDGADSITLSSAPAITSEIFGGRAGGMQGSGSILAEPAVGHTELYDLNATGICGMQVQVRDPGSTSTAFSWADVANGTDTGYDLVGVAIEIKETTSVGSVDITGTPATVTVTAGSATIGYITHIASAAEGGFNTATTAAIDTTDADFIVIFASQSEGTNGTLSDSEGNTWQLASGSPYVQSGWAEFFVYYCANPVTDVNHTFTYAAATLGPALAVGAFSGIHATPFDQINGVGYDFSDSDPIQPGSITPTEDNCLVVTGFMSHQTGLTDAACSGYIVTAIEDQQGGDHAGCGIGYQIQGTATATNPPWTNFSGSFGATAVVSFKHAAGAGSVDITGTPATVTVTAGSATIGVGNIFAEYFTGTDGANLGNGWVDDSGFGGAGIDIKYQSNRGSTLNNVDTHAGLKAHGLDVSDDWQIDFDCYAPLITTEGGVVVALVSNTTFEGWAVFVGNAVHIQRYNSGGSHDNLTNDDRPGSSGSSQSHITFTRRGSDGFMEIYLDGVWLGSATDNSHDAGNTCLVTVSSTNSPTPETWIDNLVISDVITGVGGGSVNLTGTPATVAVTAGSAVITATTAVTGTPATVTVTAGVADIVVAAPDPVLIAVRGVRNNNGTGDATVTVLNPTDIAVGNYLVARIAVDNSGSSGARPGLNVTDSRSHTWTDPSGALQDPGSASSGIACYLAYVKVVTPFQAGDTFLFDWTTGTPRSAIVIEEWANIDQITPLAVAQVTAQNVSTTAQPAISRTPTAIGQLMYVAAALEGLSSYWGAQDSDTTGGSWGDLTKDEANTGTASTSVSVYGGYKVVTSTAAQTWNNTLGTTSDWAACAVVFAKQPVTTNITGTPAWVTVSTESAVVTGHADVVGTSASVAVQAGSGVLTADTAITGIPATVVVTAGVAQVGMPVDITGTSATVVVTAGSAVIGVQTNITGTSATVAIATGSAVIGVQTNITGTSAVVSVSAGVGTITGQADVIGTSAVVNIMAGSATIISGSDVIGIPATVYISAGTATITADTNIVGISAVVAITAGVGNIVGEANVTGTSATVTVTAGSAIVISGSDIIGIPATVYVVSSTGVITAQADIVGTTSLIAITAGVGQIDVITNIIAVSAIVSIIAGIAQISAEGSHIPPVPQGAIVIL